MRVPDESTARPDHVWISEKDFNAALKALLARFKEIGLSGIIEKPEPLTILYCWLQLGSKHELTTEIMMFTRDDQEFLKFIKALRTWIVHSERGKYLHLRAEVINHFTDFDSVLRRLREISYQGGDASRELAQQLLDVVEDDR